MYNSAIVAIHIAYYIVGGFFTADYLCFVSPIGNSSFAAVAIVAILLTRLLLQYIPGPTYFFYWATCAYWLVIELTSFVGAVITAWLIIDVLARRVIQGDDQTNSELNQLESAPADPKIDNWRRRKFAQDFIRSFPPSNATMTDLPHNFEKNNHEEDCGTTCE